MERGRGRRLPLISLLTIPPPSPPPIIICLSPGDTVVFERWPTASAVRVRVVPGKGGATPPRPPPTPTPRAEEEEEDGVLFTPAAAAGMRECA